MAGRYLIMYTDCMTYRDIIADLPKQFAWEPRIENFQNLRPMVRGMFLHHLANRPKFKTFIIAGMGGSRLGPDLLKMLWPDLNIHIHSNFGLPAVHDPAETLVIASSYSGSTAETVSAADEALKKGLPLAIVTSGGKLLELAQARQLPHIIIPEKGIPPRTAVGYSLVAMTALTGVDLKMFSDWQAPISPEIEKQATDIAELLKGGIPLIYCPDQSKELSYLWKTVLNETAKVPAFCNRYPELFHNEIASYDSELAKQLRVLVIGEGQEKLLEFLKSKNIRQAAVTFTKLSDAIILSHLTALALAEIAGVDPISTPAIDEFKRS